VKSILERHRWALTLWRSSMPSTVTLPTASAWWRRWRRTLTVDIQPTKIRTLLQSRFVLLTVLLIAVSLASVGYIARELTPRTAALGAGSRSASRPTVAVPAVTAKRSLPAGDYDIVVSRNLFNPTRTETGAATAAATASAPGAPRPTLYGVVLSDDAPIAYLEDPATRRVAGYRTGDAFAGGTVGLITADHVVLVRPEGRVEVHLNDPSKPRPPASQPPPARGPTSPPSDAVQPPGVPRSPQGRLPKES